MIWVIMYTFLQDRLQPEQNRAMRYIYIYIFFLSHNVNPRFVFIRYYNSFVLLC